MSLLFSYLNVFGFFFGFFFPCKGSVLAELISIKYKSRSLYRRHWCAEKQTERNQSAGSTCNPAPSHQTHTQSKRFTDRSKAVLLLWFPISVIVHCMSLQVCPGEIFILDRNHPLGFLLVVFWLWCRGFKCVSLSLWFLGQKVFGNCIDSRSLSSFLFDSSD